MAEVKDSVRLCRELGLDQLEPPTQQDGLQLEIVRVLAQKFPEQEIDRLSRTMKGESPFLVADGTDKTPQEVRRDVIAQLRSLRQAS